MKMFVLSVLLGVCLVSAGVAATEDKKPAATPDWSMNATIIEACSCPMFCQCYFNTKPAGRSSHGEMEHFCRFNNVFQVNKGHWGDVKLDGAKFWVAGDLGPDWSKGKMDWNIVVFDPSVTKEQREGIDTILHHMYEADWSLWATGKDGKIEWKADKQRAVARLDEGAGGEVILRREAGMTDDPIVIKNLKYWGAPRNDGFILMPSEVEAFRAVPPGKKPFQFENSNGFMITVDFNSKDVASAK